MYDFINDYCKLLTKLGDCKKNLIDLCNKKNINYLKYVNDIDDLLFEKYLKIEFLIKETNKK